MIPQVSDNAVSRELSEAGDGLGHRDPENNWRHEGGSRECADRLSRSLPAAIGFGARLGGMSSIVGLMIRSELSESLGAVRSPVHEMVKREASDGNVAE